jgi:hypothetical protein
VSQSARYFFFEEAGKSPLSSRRNHKNSIPQKKRKKSESQLYQSHYTTNSLVGFRCKIRFWISLIKAKKREKLPPEFFNENKKPPLGEELWGIFGGNFFTAYTLYITTY